MRLSAYKDQKNVVKALRVALLKERDDNRKRLMLIRKHDRDSDYFEGYADCYNEIINSIDFVCEQTGVKL